MRVSRLTIALSAFGLLLEGCTSGGDSRSKPTGTTVPIQQISPPAPPVSPTAPATPTPAVGGSATPAPTGTVGTTDNGVATLPVQPTSKTLEQCNAQNQAWRAVVQSGNAPDDCVDTLVTWCCSRQEIELRYPSVAAQLESTGKDPNTAQPANFATFIDQQNLVLYACSFNGGSNVSTFHMAKIVNGTTTYKTLYTTVPQVDTGHQKDASCPVVTTASLQKASLLLMDPADRAVDSAEEFEIMPRD